MSSEREVTWTDIERAAKLRDPQLAELVIRYMEQLRVAGVAGAHPRADDEQRRAALVDVVVRALRVVLQHEHHRALPERRVAQRVDHDPHGRGFDPEAAIRAGRSRGLVGMRERAELLGGELTIASAPGEGATVTAVFPLG